MRRETSAGAAAEPLVRAGPSRRGNSRRRDPRGCHPIVSYGLSSWLRQIVSIYYVPRGPIIITGLGPHPRRFARRSRSLGLKAVAPVTSTFGRLRSTLSFVEGSRLTPSALVARLSLSQRLWPRSTASTCSGFDEVSDYGRCSPPNCLIQDLPDPAVESTRRGEGHRFSRPCTSMNRPSPVLTMFMSTSARQSSSYAQIEERLASTMPTLVAGDV